MCPHCDKTFSLEKGLFNHIKNVHSKCKIITCNLCVKKFSTESALQKHVNDCHTEPSSKNVFSSKSSLRHHEKKTHPNGIT